MTIPVWVLLLFAAWTILLLFITIGHFRWSRILTGRATIREMATRRSSRNRLVQARNARSCELSRKLADLYRGGDRACGDRRLKPLVGYPGDCSTDRPHRAIRPAYRTRANRNGRRCAIWLRRHSDRMHDYHGGLRRGGRNLGRTLNGFPRSPIDLVGTTSSVLANSSRFLRLI